MQHQFAWRQSKEHIDCVQHLRAHRSLPPWFSFPCLLQCCGKSCHTLADKAPCPSSQAVADVNPDANQGQGHLYRRQPLTASWSWRRTWAWRDNTSSTFVMPILALPPEVLFLIIENVQRVTCSPLTYCKSPSRVLTDLSWIPWTSGLFTTAAGHSEFARLGSFFRWWKSDSMVYIQLFSIPGPSHQGRIAFCRY